MQPFSLMHCTELNWTELNWKVLHCIAMHCNELNYITLHCNILHCTAKHCTALHYTALQCNVRHCTALKRIALHYTTVHCNIMHYPSVHLNKWPRGRIVWSALNSKILHVTALRCTPLVFPLSSVWRVNCNDTTGSVLFRAWLHVDTVPALQVFKNRSL